MSRISCTLYGLQHCMGGGGWGRENSRCIFTKLIIGDFLFDHKWGWEKWRPIMNWPGLQPWPKGMGQRPPFSSKHNQHRLPLPPRTMLRVRSPKCLEYLVHFMDFNTV